MLLLTNSVNGQSTFSDANRVNYISLSAINQNKVTVDKQFTALLIRSSSFIDFNKYVLRLNKDTIYFEQDIHSPDNYFQSNLIHVDEPINYFEWISIGGKAGVEMVFIDGSLEQQLIDDVKYKEAIAPENDCAAPDLISQTIWREGLSAPNYNRAFSTVYNIIVHHSAGSNNSTNYLQTVRDIYLYHTQVNGWSDIGYNYLVDPEGTIYAGRDPSTGDQDNVLGAHFCGSNTGTMGICLLGNYELVNPTSQMLAGLENILAWKINKEEQLTANGVNSHPLNSNLAQIAGHRDGCSTLCPGENVYNRLIEIRGTVETIIQTCNVEDSTDGGPVEPEEPEQPDPDYVVVDIDVNAGEVILENYTLFPNPVARSRALFMYLPKEKQPIVKRITILNATGQIVSAYTNSFLKNYIKINLASTLKPGVYFINIYQENKLVTKRFILL